MKEAKTSPTSKDKAAPVDPPEEANHNERIKSQVLATIGRPPRLDHVEVSRHHGSKYRINIWQHPESDKNVAVTISPRIGLSYYLTVSDTGDIIDSNPPLTKLCSSA
jgi:hypothetical protein